MNRLLPEAKNLVEFLSTFQLETKSPFGESSSLLPRFLVFLAVVFLGGGVANMENSSALLITYPDYPVNTDSFYGNANNVGHSGVLLIRNDGFTKYYEFGRYDEAKRGEVRNVPVPNAQLASDGRITASSLKPILSKLSSVYGKGGRIRAAYFINVDFDKMLGQATIEQPIYDILAFNCGIYAETVILQGNSKIDRPLIINPTPVNIVDEYVEEGNAEVLFTPANGELIIGKGDESDAKKP